MEIKERDSQHLVIEPRLREKLGNIPFLIVGGIITFVVGASLSPGGYVLPVVFLLFVFGLIIGKKVVVDKLTESITLETRPFVLIHKKHTIPFSSVNALRIDYEHQGGGEHSAGRDIWKISCDTGNKKVKIAFTTNIADGHYLANQISDLMGKEVVDNSAKPEISLEGLKRGIKRIFRKGGNSRD